MALRGFVLSCDRSTLMDVADVAGITCFLVYLLLCNIFFFVQMTQPFYFCPPWIRPTKGFVITVYEQGLSNDAGFQVFYHLFLAREDDGAGGAAALRLFSQTRRVTIVTVDHILLILRG